MANSPIEIWGGVECTINRVRDQYFNQLQRSGHWERASDLELIADLGISALRFPVLWEALAPDSPEQIDWSWPDQRLEAVRRLGLRPIVGLLHHGSGPRYTSLVDPAFPEKFAAFAAQVARRYPWVDAYTPINEPLTTARFSGLYGHWYPHGRASEIFARILLNECRATVAAMKAIREVNPAAILVQTDDLGRTYSTPELRYQAEFENQRRWLTWDLLEGRVASNEHPLFSFFQGVNIPAEELECLARNPCPADLIGINYYVTSERYLDEEVDCYPNELRGGNGRHLYADDAAVRARAVALCGSRALLAEAAERYGRPVALTEVHLGCTLDEQMRWLMEAWSGAQFARSRGADVRAVTVWALLGSHDWDSLVTRRNGHYEPGVFSVQNGKVEATPLADMVRGLAREGTYHHPTLETPGWWRRRSRFRQFAAAELAA